MRRAILTALFALAVTSPLSAGWGGGSSGYSRATPGYAGFGYASYGHAGYQYSDYGWGGWGGGYAHGHGGPCWDCANVWDGFCEEKARHGHRYTGFPPFEPTPNGYSMGGH